jgi:site-specific DNA-cytosine methylase
MKNSDKKILDLCGGTGAWSKPYKDAGYDVRIINIPRKSVNFFTPPDKVYGILAAPPCTYFSFARRKNMIKEERQFQKGLVVVDACTRIIQKCIIAGNLKFWALENPRGFLRWFLGKPPFNFDPCDFGDPWTKQARIISFQCGPGEWLMYLK